MLWTVGSDRMSETGEINCQTVQGWLGLKKRLKNIQREVIFCVVNKLITSHLKRFGHVNTFHQVAQLWRSPSWRKILRWTPALARGARYKSPGLEKGLNIPKGELESVVEKNPQLSLLLPWPEPGKGKLSSSTSAEIKDKRENYN